MNIWTSSSTFIRLEEAGRSERRTMASPSAKRTEVVTVTTAEDASGKEEDESELETAHQAREEDLAAAQEETEDPSKRHDLSSQEAVIVKLTEEVDMEADVFYPITCGDSKATLLWKKFVCPGINVKCVEFNEQLISPKEFVCLAGKSTLKDWKRAIRFNGNMLRKIMDSGELDFYQHAKVCSNTCRSTKIDVVANKVSVSSDQSAEAASSTSCLNGGCVSEEPSEWVTAIREDSLTFWRAVKEAGLLEEVMEDFQKDLQELLKGLQERVSQPPLQVKDAALLNNIVQNFGMLDLVKKVVSSHKSQMDHYREQYTSSLAALEQQCDEHRKRAKELKSKSQHLNNVLMNLAPAPPPPKRPRSGRSISSPVSISPAPTQVTLPLSHLSGVALGKLLTVAGAPAASNLGGYTLLTSPLNGSELVADASNLTVLSTVAGQEGASAESTFVKMLGPQFQLLTLPAAIQGLAATQNGGTLAQPLGSFAVVDDIFLQGVQDEEGQANEVRGEE
ncbi:glucocorticoid modulatory element-binding protein 2-like isoform X1 [Nerophis ophidion]|uniref:glucocorticoid modulatory element-binding protein 2-like isoform X1 n=2 Tax=Nerophis ophidion TaxID=159077 RepID=UPI002ADF04F4|nr:glucocorticoid modulatory element-binding protein 2-like isoform X1 [Nerophis ophidion]